MTRAMRGIAIVGAALAAAGCAGAPAPEVAETWTEGEDEGPAGLAVAMRDLGRRLAPRGLVPHDFGEEGFFVAGQGRSEAIAIPAGRCVSITALGATGLSDLDAAIYDPSGELLTEDVEPDAHPTVQICAGNEARDVYYHLTAYAGAGAYLVGAFVTSDAAALDAVRELLGGRPGVARADGSRSEGDSDAAFRERGDGLRRRGFEPDGPPHVVEIVAGQTIRAPLPVEAGVCYTVLGDVERGADVELRVLDESDAEVARGSTAEGELGVQACADRDAAWQLEIVVRAGRGAIEWALYTGASADVGGSSGLWLGERVAARPPTSSPCRGSASTAGTLAFRTGEARAVRTRSTGCQRLVLDGASLAKPWSARVLDADDGSFAPARAGDVSGSWSFTACAPAGHDLRFHVVAGENASVRARIEHGCDAP